MRPGEAWSVGARGAGVSCPGVGADWLLVCAGDAGLVAAGVVLPSPSGWACGPLPQEESERGTSARSATPVSRRFEMRERNM